MSPKHRADAAASETAAEALAADIRFVTKGLSPEEVAAATAVLTAALQQARARDALVATQPRSEWVRTTRALRRPFTGGWRGFTAEGL